MCDPGSAMTALKIAGTVFSAYTAVKGLKEGNILQAVVGGIGAYAGFSHLQEVFGKQVMSGAAKEATSDILADKLAVNVAPDVMEKVSGGLFDAISTPLAEGAEASLGTFMPGSVDAMAEGASIAAPELGSAAMSVPGINGSLNGGLLHNPQAAALSQTANSAIIPTAAVPPNSAAILPPTPASPTIMNQISKGYDGLKGLLGDNQQLAGYGLQYMGAQDQQDFLEDQLDKRAAERAKEEAERAKLRGYAATAPTFNYGYGVA